MTLSMRHARAIAYFVYAKLAELRSSDMGKFVCKQYFGYFV